VTTAASKVADAKPAAKPEAEPEAKPPQAPPDPVYTSFTAEPAAPIEIAAEPDTAKAAPVKTAQAKPRAAPKAVEQKPAEPNPEAATGGSYLLQAGVFAEMANAQRQLEMLTQHQIDAHVECKVRIGPFANKDAVESAREKVSAAGISATLEDYISSKGMMLQSIVPDMESAKQLQDSLTELGFSSRSETRILVGPYDTKAKADTMRNKIKALNISVVLM
jgi:cell division protein FtsN